MIAPAELIAQARSLVGVPWRHQGRSEFGVDCIGFVSLSMRRAGLDLAAYLGIRDVTNYSRRADPELYRRVSMYCQRIAEPRPGCLIFFQFDGDRAPRHFGIFTERDTVIHANAMQQQVVEHGYRAQWLRWTHSRWLLPGVDYGTAP